MYRLVKKYVTIWLHKATPMKNKIGKNVIKRKKYKINNNHNLISVWTVYLENTKTYINV